MGWKDWSYVKKGVIVGLIFFTLSSLPLLEMNLWKCEPILNFGGPTHPYCLTIIFSLPLLGFILFEHSNTFYGIVFLAISLIFHLLIGTLIFYIVGKIKSRKQEVK